MKSLKMCGVLLINYCGKQKSQWFSVHLNVCPLYKAAFRS